MDAEVASLTVLNDFPKLAPLRKTDRKAIRSKLLILLLTFVLKRPFLDMFFQRDQRGMNVG